MKLPERTLDARRPQVRSEADLDEALAAAPTLVQLHLEGPAISEAMIARVASASDLGGVKAFSLRWMDASDAYVAALSGSAVFRGVRLLEIEHAGLTAAGTGAIAAAGVGELRTLALYNRSSHAGQPNRIDDDALRALASGRGPLRIESLALSHTQVARAGIEALSASATLPALGEVTAWRTCLTEEDQSVLAPRVRFRLFSDFDPRTIDYGSD